MNRDMSRDEKVRLIKQNLEYFSFVLEIARGMTLDALGSIEKGDIDEALGGLVDMHITLVDANAFYRAASALYRLSDI